MAFQPTFVEELNSLTGDSVEVAYDSTLITGVVGFAEGDLLGLVESLPYSNTNQVVYIVLNAIQTVRVLT